MKRNMKQWLEHLIADTYKKPMPVLSFPAVQLMGISVKALIADSGLQAKAMQLIAERTDAAASVSMMDLSVEAECFGSDIRVSDDEVPTIIGRVITDSQSADALTVPKVGTKRTGIYIDAIRAAAQAITDRPVFAGVIGPFSLAGRLVDVSEAMILCYEDPDMMHTVLNKTTAFLIEYTKAYKAAGANGIVMAEPLTGLLSPDLAAEFSTPYVKRINEAVQDDNFIVIYHNCGNGTIRMVDSILETKSAAYHFGNAIDMAEMLQHIPANTVAMGNVDPAGVLKNGTPALVRADTHRIMEACRPYQNFVISSGCDIPPMTPWANIDAFFQAVKDFT